MAVEVSQNEEIFGGGEKESEKESIQRRPKRGSINMEESERGEVV